MSARSIIVALALCLGCSSDGGGAGASGGAAGAGPDASAGSAGASNGGAGGAAGAGASAGSGGVAGAAGAAAAGGAGAAGAPSVPAELLDLQSWKLTLPIAASGSTKPLEIEQPELATYSHDQYFHLTALGDGVVFRAHAGGVTTSNSGYPRSELREMTNGGADLASWSTSSGTHTLTLRQAITHLPVAKPHVVAGQIHDAGDDVVMIRLEGEYLFVEGGGDDLGALDPSYTLGEAFDLRIRAQNGQIHVYYQDLTTPKVSVARAVDGCYFKAGAYTQSNTGTGDEPSAYGEVVIHALDVTHE